MLIYTIVLRGSPSEPPIKDDDVASWAASHLDSEIMTIRGLFESAYLGDWILRVATSLEPDDYVKAAFEGSLNADMRDDMSPVVWWNVKAEKFRVPKSEAKPQESGLRQPRGRASGNH